MKKKAFTLIELLVVIAIIALLLSVIVPSLKKAKETARAISCRSNLRQMTVACSTYSIENDGKIFPFGYTGDYGYWFRNIAPYLGDRDFKENPRIDGSGVMKIGICPSTKIQTDDDDGTAPDKDHTWYWGQENIIGSYSINAWVQPDPDGWSWGWGSVSETDSKARMFDGQYAQLRGDVGVIADAYRMDNWPSQVSGIKIPTAEQLIKPTDVSHDLKSFMLRFTMDRHNMAINVGFVDGSAGKVTLEDLYLLKWNREDGPMQVSRIPQ